MSDERKETVSDIMSEMREYADSMEKHLIYDLSECSTDYLRVLADRIEDAINRENRTAEKSSPVGNTAKMLEALQKIVLLTVKAGMSIRFDVACGIIANTARCALAAPPRNCDVGTAEEQMRRIKK